jgi:hypothetical protein
MSGPLASWVSDHAHVDPTLLRDEDGRLIASEKAVVDVVIQLALTSYHDGTSAYAPTWDELAHRTRTSRSTVAAALKVAVALKLVTVDRPGRGRGKATVYRVLYTLCDGTCWACETLAAELEKVQQPDLNGSRKGPSRGRKGPGGRRKGPAAGPTTDNRGTAPTSGGAVPPGESNDSGAGSTPHGAGPAREEEPQPIRDALGQITGYQWRPA